MQRLFRRYARFGDTVARDELVERFLPLARGLARRYRRGNDPIDDLVQVASIGLLGAIDRFDPERGGDFTTFAIPTIVGELKRHYRDHAWAMKVTRGEKERMLAVTRAAEALSVTHGRSPTPLELAGHTGLDVERVLAGLELAAAARPASLDEPAGPSDGEPRTIGEFVGGEDAALGLVETRDIVDRSVRMLSPRDRRIVHMRFVEDRTQGEIGADVGLSQMQVSRILRKVLARLREHADATSAATAGEAPYSHSICVSGTPCARA